MRTTQSVKVMVLALGATVVFGCASILSLVWAAPAGSGETHAVPPPAGVTSPLGTLAYVPPKTRNPGGRVGAATRGLDDQLPTVMALVPETHTGLSSHDQPSLYWFLSKPTTYPVEFVVQVGTEAKPFLETRLKPPAKAGIQEIRLQDYAVRLQSGVIYQWYVQIIPDQQDRTKDAVAGGFLMFREANPDVLTALRQTPKEDAPRVLAEAGLWYDALTALANLITTAQSNQLYRQERAAILKQERLPAVAAWDLSQATTP